MLFIFLALYLQNANSPANTIDAETTREFHSLKDLNPSSPHWPEKICSSRKHSIIHVFCSDAGINETEGPKALIEINFTQNGIRHDFLPRHAIAMPECVEMRYEIKKILKKQNSFCVQGDSGTYHPSEKSISWVFDGIKTNKGKVCWLDEC